MFLTFEADLRMVTRSLVVEGDDFIGSEKCLQTDEIALDLLTFKCAEMKLRKHHRRNFHRVRS